MRKFFMFTSRSISLRTVLFLMFLFCSAAVVRGDENSGNYDRETEMPARVAALSESNAGLWILAGGQLTATTDDAMDLEGLSSETISLGDMDHVSLEALAALEPDLVILFSTDPAQKALGEAAEEIGINVFYTNIDRFDDYDEVMSYFTQMTGREDLYEKNVKNVRSRIEEICARVPERTEKKTFLLLHVSATKSKVEKDDYFACEIFSSLGLSNIASDNSSFHELSVEQIVVSDPDYIFVVPRGDETRAMESFEDLFSSQPAWESLTAVKNGNCYLLEKDLFGLKPNDRWARSYEQAFELLYGE